MDRKRQLRVRRNAALTINQRERAPAGGYRAILRESDGSTGRFQLGAESDEGFFGDVQVKIRQRIGRLWSRIRAELVRFVWCPSVCMLTRLVSFQVRPTVFYRGIFYFLLGELLFGGRSNGIAQKGSQGSVIEARSGVSFTRKLRTTPFKCP